MDERPEWFAAKSHGLGSGLPIAWQGWLLLIGYMVVLLTGGLILAPRGELAFLALIIPITVAVLWIAAKTTRGGWRWRWGREE